MFWKIYTELCVSKGLSPNGVASQLHIASGSVTKWKNGATPSPKNLKKIADFFDVSTSYLLGTQLDLNLQAFADRTAPSMVLHASGPENFYGDDPSKHEPRANLLELDENNVRFIPVLESVSAGLGAIAINDIIDYQPIYFNHPAEAKDHICLKVKGDSMYPKIEEGDVILIKKQDSVDSGSLAVVLLDGEEGLVKRIEYGEDWIELHSINPMYKTMRFDGPDVLRLRVVGLVKKIIKSV